MYIALTSTIKLCFDFQTITSTNQLSFNISDRRYLKYGYCKKINEIFHQWFTQYAQTFTFTVFLQLFLKSIFPLLKKYKLFFYHRQVSFAKSPSSSNKVPVDLLEDRHGCGLGAAGAEAGRGSVRCSRSGCGSGGLRRLGVVEASVVYVVTTLRGDAVEQTQGCHLVSTNVIIYYNKMFCE